jgi:Tol biopolymer transport system component
MACAEDDLADKARAVLQTHCARCHADGNRKGGFDYLLRRDLLAARGKIAPGKATESEIFQRIRDGDMPPKKEKDRPSKEQLAVLEQWLNAGAPDWRTAASPGKILTEGQINRAIRADLEALPAQQRRFLRYFTIANLTNAGRSEEELAGYRLGLTKLLNSLSWHPRISAPVAIDETHAVYRIDLRDYKWNSRLWDKMAAVYPYRTGAANSDATRAAVLAGTEKPCLRADWFIATASRPPLYYDLLEMPATDKALERLLQVDAAANIDEQSVARAGFNGSGVSKNNRIIERHDAGHGAYWKTYDFAENVDRQNIFERPLGPPPARNSFVHSGGEMIFHLPNGLLGYYLADRGGRRLERAPVDIVSDPEKPDKTVEAGLSCFRCHAGGMIPKADQVRAHVLKNAQAFAKEDVELVKALYRPEAKLKDFVDQDNKRYREALDKVKVKADGAEVITTVTQHYEAVVDVAAAAAEAGLNPTEFAERLGKSADLSRSLGALRAKGGSVQRETFAAAFADVAKEFRLGSEPSPEPAASGAFSGHTQAIRAVVVSVDGSRAVSASDDRTVRLWDGATGKELRRFEGHTGAVVAVALSPDGRRIVSGSQDRTVRVWESETGKELRVLKGHTDAVSAVAFSPDGRRVLSGGQDFSVRLWDSATGQEIRQFAGHGGRVNSIAFSPDGSKAASASHDQTVRLWDLATGEALRVLRGHLGEVYSVAFAPDGKSIAAGSNDKTVRLWGAESGQEIRRLEGHENAVIQVAFSADGKRLFSGSSQYQTVDRAIRVWDLADGKEVRSFPGLDKGRISCLAFSKDGKLALIDGSEPVLRLWKLAE